MVRLTIDGIPIEVTEGTTLLQAARSLDIKVPTLCYHQLLDPFGAGRMCLVEVGEDNRSLVTACNTTSKADMVVSTTSKAVVHARRLILEMLLARWPSVPILKEYAQDVDLFEPRFISEVREDEIDACIRCGLCVRTCDEVVGAHAITFSGRGTEREVTTPFGIESESCIACGACALVCPTAHITFEVEDYKGRSPDLLLGPNTAIYIPTPQSIPKVPSIDAESCIHFKTGECRKCVDVCEAHAINHEMQEETVELDVGQVLVTTGFDAFDPSGMPQYGYGRLDNVFSSLDVERMFNASGPTDGKVLMKSGKEPRAVGIVHCVGSRDENHHRYCSRVCCMYALKFAHLVKERCKAEVYNFYIDVRAYGKGFEEFYLRVLNEGVNVIRGKVAEVVESRWSCNGDGSLLVRCEDTLIGQFREIPVDMVILCNALEARRDAEQVGRLFGLSRSPDGFFLERHPKLDPVATTSDGLFVAGCAQGPKDIPDSVAQASAAAARMLGTISKGQVEIDPVRAEISSELCSGCRTCDSVCPYNAIIYIEGQKISEVNSTLCKGCGTCVAACPSGAIGGHGFSDDQIFAELEGLLAV
jgi:heterodisulfide reductase subunit A